MKKIHPSSFLTRILRPTKLACALTALAMLTACASILKTTDSSLPIETIDATGGKVTGTRAFESSDRLYVSGHINKSFGSHVPYSAHVDIRLIGNTGRVIAEKEDAIEPSHPKAGGRSGQISYVASFPISEARQASKIVVRYHLNRQSL